jgi:DnaJ-class molecular chaperone
MLTDKIIICDNCNGEGYMLNDYTYKLDKNKICWKCEGEGKIIKFKYTNYFKISERQFTYEINKLINDKLKELYNLKKK